MVALLAAACSEDRPPADGTTGAGPSAPPTSATAAPTPTSGDTPSPAPGDLGAARVRLAEVAVATQPLAMGVRDGDDSIYLAGQSGLVMRLPAGGGEAETVLDLSGSVTAGGERGLLGLAFSPDGAFLYVNYTDLEGDTRIVEYPVGPDGDVAQSPREVLRIGQPFANHNGGNLVFGPDGFLYIGMGDGGSGGDPMGNGQSLQALLGKMLRIDPRPDGSEPYGVPGDNPFVGRAGARPEIWAYGLRNPWRYSFDRETGDLWIGDVGQSSREEIDFQPADSPGGENYGWNLAEGSLPYEGDPDGTRLPIHEYPTGGGNCAVTGGYVYRGASIPALTGAYVFADFCVGEIMALTEREGRVVEGRSLGLTVPNLSSFGEDQSGELYAISLEGAVLLLEPG
jgi:glucose/arabinose dehydrogenase